MSVLCSDAAFRKKLKAILKADREDLWRELNDVACFFALIGAPSPALLICQFMYSGMVPMPDPDDRTISVFGDAAVSSLCDVMGQADLSKGIPEPHKRTRDGVITFGGELSERVEAVDHWSRSRISGDAWCGVAWSDSPPPEFVPVAELRKARILASPCSNGKPSDTENEALAKLTHLLADSDARSKLHPCDQAAAFLLAAEIAARHRLAPLARKFLQSWHDLAIDWDYDVFEALSMRSTMRLLCDGALASKHRLSTLACDALATSLIADLRIRLSQAEPEKPPKWKYRIYVSYGQFYLEPLTPDPAACYWQEDGESDQGFSSFPTQVAFGVPGDSDECVIEAAICEKAPSIRNAVQAVAVPITVEQPGGLYIRTVNDSGKKCRLEVPPGQYEVLARFFPRKPRKSSCFDSWRVHLAFLPARGFGAACLRSARGAPPAAIFVHE